MAGSAFIAITPSEEEQKRCFGFEKIEIIAPRESDLPEMAIEFEGKLNRFLSLPIWRKCQAHQSEELPEAVAFAGGVIEMKFGAEG